jgi:Fe2+ or Zn2+ uptake regulation protein
MRYLINLFPTSAKTIFSFKAGDEYLKLGIPILRIGDHPGDPFADREAFVQSFLVTYPMNSQGIMAASVPNLLRTAIRESGSWAELRKNIETVMEKEKQGSITHSTYSFIQQKLADLELQSQPYSIDLNKDIVLDFSGLNEAAKTFYAELYLRQAWHSIEASQPEPMKHIIIIDETHRLLRSEATIFGEVARLIRSRGAIWCGTQNYTDLPDYVRNQFAMHLLFSTKSDKDLKALREINILLPFTATELKDHHFTDAATRELHDAIPIYTADIQGFKDVEPVYLKPAIIEVRKEKIGVTDATEAVLKIIEEEASWPNDVARRIATQFNTDIDTAKLSVTNALHRLHKEGFVARENIKVKGNEIILYYKKDSSLSGLHKFMENKIIRELEVRRIAYELPKGREGEPDISTQDLDIEIETGLKNNIAPFADRLSAKTKKTLVIVPNELEFERYKKTIPNAIILTLNGYLEEPISR